MSFYKPEVGDRCLFYRDDGSDYREGWVIAYDITHPDKIVVRDAEYGNYVGCYPRHLRQIKTSADYQIEEMIKIGAGNEYASVDNYDSAYVDVIKRLHKAGYRLEGEN